VVLEFFSFFLELFSWFRVQKYRLSHKASKFVQFFLLKKVAF